MKVKDLIKELQKLPEDSNITISSFFDEKEGHLAVRYYDKEEGYWCSENEIDFFLANRDKFPKKVRFRLEPNDESYRKHHNEKEVNDDLLV